MASSGKLTPSISHPQIIRVNKVVKICNKSNEDVYTVDEHVPVPEQYRTYYEHYLQLFQKCVILDTTLTSAEMATNITHFPAIIGRRPMNLDRSTIRDKENVPPTFAPGSVKINEAKISET